MLDSQSETSEFDWDAHLETLRALAGVMDEAKLSEIEVEHDGVRLSLKSAAARKIKVQAAPIIGGEMRAEEVFSDEETFAAPLEELEEAAQEIEGHVVVSPMVGIFYRAPSPSEPNFVEIGDRIEIGQTLGLVETMKVFNEITSEVEGTVSQITVANLALVETGDALMRIQTA